QRLLKVFWNAIPELVAIPELSSTTHVTKFDAAAIPLDAFTGVRFHTAPFQVAFAQAVHSEGDILLGGFLETLDAAFEILGRSSAALKAHTEKREGQPVPLIGSLLVVFECQALVFLNAIAFYKLSGQLVQGLWLAPGCRFLQIIEIRFHGVALYEFDAS